MLKAFVLLLVSLSSFGLSADTYFVEKSQDGSYVRVLKGATGADISVKESFVPIDSFRVDFSGINLGVYDIDTSEAIIAAANKGGEVDSEYLPAFPMSFTIKFIENGHGKAVQGWFPPEFVKRLDYLKYERSLDGDLPTVRFLEEKSIGGKFFVSKSMLLIFLLLTISLLILLFGSIRHFFKQGARGEYVFASLCSVTLSMAVMIVVYFVASFLQAETARAIVAYSPVILFFIIAVLVFLFGKIDIGLVIVLASAYFPVLSIVAIVSMNWRWGVISVVIFNISFLLALLVKDSLPIKRSFATKY